MLGAIILIMMIASVAAGLVNGSIHEVSAAAVSSCTRAVELVIFLSGTMALWGGLMRIAEKCGITKTVCKLISPVTRLLFKGLDKNSEAAQAVSMNLSANLLGLGNASTPLGIKAAKALSAPTARHKKRNTAMLVVLNTASIQLIPTTMAAIRLAHGSESPFDITLPVLATSLVSAAAGCIMVGVLYMKEQSDNDR